MMNSMKRIILTGAAAAVMMSFAAAPAMALPKVVEGIPDVVGPGVVDPPEPPDPPDPDPFCDIRPFGCGNTPDPVLDPGDNTPPDNTPPDNTPPDNTPPDNTPPDNTPPDNTPPDNTPPDNTPPDNTPPDKEDPRNEESDTSGPGGSSGGSSGDGGGIGSASETIDRGGTFVSSFLPTTLTSTIGEAGNSMKKNLPAPVAKSLPETGGGWVTLALAGGALLLAGGFLIRRFSN